MPRRSQRIERVFEWPLIVAALLVLPVLIIEEADVGEPLSTIIDIGNWAIWTVFAAYLVAMLATVNDRWQWLRHNTIDAAIVVLTPPFMPAALQSLRFLRLLRLVRLLAVAKYARRVFSFEGLRCLAMLTILMLVASGAAYTRPGVRA